MTQFCIMSDTEGHMLNNEQTQYLIGHLVAAVARGIGATIGVTECPDGCHKSIMVNGERAASVTC